LYPTRTAKADAACSPARPTAAAPNAASNSDVLGCCQQRQRPAHLALLPTATLLYMFQAKPWPESDQIWKPHPDMTRTVIG